MENNEYMEPCPYCSGQRYKVVKLKPCANGDIGVDVMFKKDLGEELGMIAMLKNEAAGYLDFKYCPFCGKPQTYEAFIDMWKRVEKLIKKEQQEGLSMDMLYSLIKNNK